MGSPHFPAVCETAAGARIDVRVMPRASRNAIAGVRDGRLVVRVTAPPVDGAANAAVTATLARAFGVPRRAIRIVAGETGRNKTIEFATVPAAVVARKLSDILA